MATNLMSYQEQLQGLRPKLNVAADHPIVAVDLCNLLTCKRCGFHSLDIEQLCSRARAEVGPNCQIRVFANYLNESTESEWRKNGAEVEQTQVNADRDIHSWLLSMRHASRVLIVSGDHFFAKAAKFHRRLGHSVTIFAKRTAAARELIYAADRVDFCVDRLVQLGGGHFRRRRPRRCTAH